MIAKSCSGVLIVDDDRDIRRSLAEVLEDEGYRVMQANNGQEALELLRKKEGLEPCVILLDITMPIMDGWQFRSEQASDPGIADIPVVVLTADGRAKDKAAKMRAFAGLSKPVTLDRLLEIVEPLCA